MALITCPECSKVVSERATSCPHCGCPINAFTQGTIHIYWANKKGDTLRKTSVEINGDSVDIMQAGDFIHYPVTNGFHKIDMYQGKHLLLSEVVEVNAQTPDVYYAFKESIGFTHCKLKRVEVDSSVWKVSDKNIPRCPTCGSEKIKKISTTKKVLSVELMGLASGSIGKTFECRKCGYKW